ncbi:MAG: invasion associated locus B family protein [Rubellimicrobium sp.]|nr:invasion associated locus B family protein [Rubellimicrobium sp.]
MRLALAIASAALLGLSLPLAAQEAATDAPAAGESTSPVDDLGLDMGSEVDQGPRAGEFYIRQEFGDWAMRCIALPDQADPCELYQLLHGPDGTAVAELTAFPLPPGGQATAGLTVVAPLETLLTEGVVLNVDGQNARRYEFSFCNRAGCIARIGLTDAEVAALKRGNRAGLRIVPAADPSHPFDLTVSLTGFTAGMESSTAYDPSLVDPNEPDVSAPEAAPAPETGDDEGAAE